VKITLFQGVMASIFWDSQGILLIFW